MNQKKILEINPRHPLIKELQRRVENEDHDETTADLARVLYETAVLRSGYALKDSSDFAGRIERMLRLSLGVDLAAQVSAVLPPNKTFMYVVSEKPIIDEIVDKVNYPPSPPPPKTTTNKQTTTTHTTG